MASVSDWKVPASAQPKAEDYSYDLDLALGAMVAVHSKIPADAFTAETLGTERAGNGVFIRGSGVVLTIGHYQLLVADACSGLNSMVSLTALGLFYLYLGARRRVLHTVTLLVSILPVAFGANIVRVLLLALVTYHFGDEAGQGFLHGFAGVVLFLAALLGLVLLDGLLTLAWGRRAHG